MYTTLRRIWLPSVIVSWIWNACWCPHFPLLVPWLLSFEIFRRPIYNNLYRLFLFSFRFSFVTGHYSQVIWADTNRVGCGFTSYRENGTLETNLYVCNYGPAGNFVALPSYKVGTPCSQCPTNTACSSRFAGLCGERLAPQHLQIVLCLLIHEAVVTEPAKKPTGTSSESTSEEVNEIIPSGSTEKPMRQPTKVTTPIAVTQRPTVTTLRPPFPSTVGNTSTVQRDFVCQVGKGSCRAVFRGAPWIFRAQPSSSINPSKYLAVGGCLLCARSVLQQQRKLIQFRQSCAVNLIICDDQLMNRGREVHKL